MNETYYQTLQSNLRTIAASFPDFLEPVEREALNSRISRLCQLAALQIAEIRDYENRYRNSQ